MPGRPPDRVDLGDDPARCRGRSIRSRCPVGPARSEDVGPERNHHESRRQGAGRWQRSEDRAARTPILRSGGHPEQQGGGRESEPTRSRSERVSGIGDVSIRMIWLSRSSTDHRRQGSSGQDPPPSHGTWAGRPFPLAAKLGMTRYTFSRVRGRHPPRSIGGRTGGERTCMRPSAGSSRRMFVAVSGLATALGADRPVSCRPTRRAIPLNLRLRDGHPQGLDMPRGTPSPRCADRGGHGRGAVAPT